LNFKLNTRVKLRCIFISSSIWLSALVYKSLKPDDDQLKKKHQSVRCCYFLELYIIVPAA